MKKLFTFITAAVTLAALMVCEGCTGSGEGSSDGADSTAVEQQDEPKASSQLVEKERFTVTLPDGWQDSKADNNGLATCCKPLKDDPSSFDYFVNIWVNDAKSMKTAELAVQHMTEKGSLKAGDDMVIGDKTFKVVNHSSSDTHCWLFTDMPQGDAVLQIEVMIGNVKDLELQQLLQSITFK